MDDHSDEWWELFWSDRSQHFGEPRKELIDKALTFRHKQTPRRLTIVDAGSGNGRYALEFAKADFLTTAIEKSVTGCQLIHERALSRGLSMNIVQCDLLDIYERAIAGEYEGFDIVFSSGLVEEVPKTKQEKIIQTLQAITKPGGLLIFKYCLEIKDRGITVEDGYVLPFFKNDQWVVLEHDTEKMIRDSLAPIDFENRLRTETIIAHKVDQVA